MADRPVSGKDHLDGLGRLLERFPAENLLWAGQPGGSRPARDLDERLAKAGTAALLAQAGQRLELGLGASRSSTSMVLIVPLKSPSDGIRPPLMPRVLASPVVISQ